MVVIESRTKSHDIHLHWKRSRSHGYQDKWASGSEYSTWMLRTRKRLGYTSRIGRDNDHHADENQFIKLDRFFTRPNMFINRSRSSVILDTKRQELLNDITKQLISVEQNVNDIHDLNGMSIRKLKHLSEKVVSETVLDYEMPEDVGVLIGGFVVLLIMILTSMVLGVREFLKLKVDLGLLQE